MASSALISDSEAWKNLKVLGLVGVKLCFSLSLWYCNAETYI